MLTVLISSGCATSTPSTELLEITNAVSPAEGIVAAGRIDADDIARLQDAGILHVIDLSTDAETPEFDEASAMRAVGIVYSSLPLRDARDLTHANVIAFDALLREAQRPVLVHCASGNRVGAMAALRAAWVDGLSMEEAVAIGKAWGLTKLEADVRRRIETGAK